MFYLVLYFSSAITIIPEKYPTEQACKTAALNDSYIKSICIPAPKSDDEFNCTTVIPNPMGGMGSGMLAKIRCSDKVIPK